MHEDTREKGLFKRKREFIHKGKKLVAPAKRKGVRRTGGTGASPEHAKTRRGLATRGSAALQIRGERDSLLTLNA